jgi:hypothetical protein
LHGKARFFEAGFFLSHLSSRLSCAHCGLCTHRIQHALPMTSINPSPHTPPSFAAALT